MNPEQFEQLITTQKDLYRLNRELLAVNLENLEVGKRREKKLDQLINSQPVKAPNFPKSLSEYPNFDWSSIGAKVIARDHDGVSEVEWNNYIFTRRSPTNKYIPAIWFSLYDGKEYQKLITFKARSNAESISRKIINLLPLNNNLETIAIAYKKKKAK